jgi:hypothetical protein
MTGSGRRFIRSVNWTAALLFITAACGPADRQLASTVETPRTADEGFDPAIEHPAFPPGLGPRVVIDETHNNFHTALGTYAPFARVLEADGYVVERGTEPLAPNVLEEVQVLVIADAQPPASAGDPPTFSPDDVDVLNNWVESGGALLLITDHMPDPGAIAGLAASFGIEVHNGYALEDALSGGADPLVFSRSEGTLADHPLTRGQTPSEAVDSVASFAGSAFRSDVPFEPLLIFGSGVRSWTPDEYWVFRRSTPNIDVAGWCQGGVLEYGRGKLAIFGEAAMFTAQVRDDGRRFGMTHDLGRQNMQLLLNVMHWLTG